MATHPALMADPRKRYAVPSAGEAAGAGRCRTSGAATARGGVSARHASAGALSQISTCAALRRTPPCLLITTRAVRRPSAGEAAGPVGR